MHYFFIVVRHPDWNISYPDFFLYIHRNSWLQCVYLRSDYFYTCCYLCIFFCIQIDHVLWGAESQNCSFYRSMYCLSLFCNLHSLSSEYSFICPMILHKAFRMITENFNVIPTFLCSVKHIYQQEERRIKFYSKLSWIFLF